MDEAKLRSKQKKKEAKRRSSGDAPAKYNTSFLQSHAGLNFSTSGSPSSPNKNYPPTAPASLVDGIFRTQNWGRRGRGLGVPIFGTQRKQRHVSTPNAVFSSEPRTMPDSLDMESLPPPPSLLAVCRWDFPNSKLGKTRARIGSPDLWNPAKTEMRSAYAVFSSEPRTMPDSLDMESLPPPPSLLAVNQDLANSAPSSPVGRKHGTCGSWPLIH
jgi:hypothetical protein